MEIERKWLTDGWPDGLPLLKEYTMRQGYISARPTVRIRAEQTGGETQYILCFKGAASADGLVRKEIETEIAPELFAQLEDLIGKPLINKIQRRYALGEGLVLEANLVDEGQPTQFFYAEVEFSTAQQAKAWQPGALSDFLSLEVTGMQGQSMAAYWQKTRGIM